jgi:hypothetical protein
MRWLLLVLMAACGGEDCPQEGPPTDTRGGGEDCTERATQDGGGP